MRVRFKKDKVKKTCESEKDLNRAFGIERAKKIRRRLEVLIAADTLEIVPHTPPERRHQLRGNRDETFAVVVEEQWRITFTPDHDPIPRKEDGGIDIAKVTSILILEICEDYH
jgi:plasmid maintenance system killer protein